MDSGDVGCEISLHLYLGSSFNVDHQCQGGNEVGGNEKRCCSTPEMIRGESGI